MQSQKRFEVNDDTGAELARLALSYSDTNHRISNSLQFLAATLHMQARALGDSAARSALVDAQRRVSAVGSMHRLLQHRGTSEVVMLDSFFEGLAAALRLAWLMPSGKLVVSLFCAAIALPKAKAVPLAMITSELICNAVKYAYPPDFGGEIRVRVTLEKPNVLALSVEDDGYGIGRSPAAAGTGQGERIIQALAARIPATIERDVSHAGTRVILRAIVD